MPYNLDDINNYGANFLGIVALSSLLAPPAVYTEYTNCLNCGDIVDTKQGQKANKTESKNEAGKTKKTDYTYDLMTNCTLMQTGASLITYLSHTVKGIKHFEAKKQFVKESGQTQWMFKIVDVTPQHQIDTPGADKSNAYESTGIFPAADTTISTVAMASFATAMGVTLPTQAITITAAMGFAILSV